MSLSIVLVRWLMLAICEVELMLALTPVFLKYDRSARALNRVIVWSAAGWLGVTSLVAGYDEARGLSTGWVATSLAYTAALFFLALGLNVRLPLGRPAIHLAQMGNMAACGEDKLPLVRTPARAQVTCRDCLGTAS